MMLNLGIYVLQDGCPHGGRAGAGGDHIGDLVFVEGGDLEPVEGGI